MPKPQCWRAFGLSKRIRRERASSVGRPELPALGALPRNMSCSPACFRNHEQAAPRFSTPCRRISPSVNVRVRVSMLIRPPRHASVQSRSHSRNWIRSRICLASLPSGTRARWGQPKEVLMPRSVVNAALSVLAVMALAACGEKPPRADPEGHRVYSNETPQHPAYERTLKQGESKRMAE
jgi:hypothetical protein